MGYVSDTIYPYYSLSFAWSGVCTRECADGEVEVKSICCRSATRYAPFGARYAARTRRVAVGDNETPPQSATSCRQLPIATWSHSGAMPL